MKDNAMQQLLQAIQEAINDMHGKIHLQTVESFLEKFKQR